jgi:hypothetical protein
MPVSGEGIEIPKLPQRGHDNNYNTLEAFQLSEIVIYGLGVALQ